MFIKINGDLYSDDAIAFVRKLNKKLPPVDAKNGGMIPGKAYVVQLKAPYALDASGKVRSIFLSSQEGERVMRQLYGKIVKEEVEDAPSTAPVDEGRDDQP